jgi:hypothetical protein
MWSCWLLSCLLQNRSSQSVWHFDLCTKNQLLSHDFYRFGSPFPLWFKRGFSRVGWERYILVKQERRGPYSSEGLCVPRIPFSLWRENLFCVLHNETLNPGLGEFRLNSVQRFRQILWHVFLIFRRAVTYCIPPVKSVCSCGWKTSCVLYKSFENVPLWRFELIIAFVSTPLCSLFEPHLRFGVHSACLSRYSDCLPDDQRDRSSSTGKVKNINFSISSRPV